MCMCVFVCFLISLASAQAWKYFLSGKVAVTVNNFMLCEEQYVQEKHEHKEKYFCVVALL